MSMSAFPTFVDKEKFSAHYLTSLRKICDKVTIAAKVVGFNGHTESRCQIEIDLMFVTETNG